jgi:hypothetical protein
MDYRALLIKYLQHVMREEGDTFIWTLYPGDGFSPEEQAALRDAEKAALGGT